MKNPPRPAWPAWLAPGIMGVPCPGAHNQQIGRNEKRTRSTFDRRKYSAGAKDAVLVTDEC